MNTTFVESGGRARHVGKRLGVAASFAALLMAAFFFAVSAAQAATNYSVLLLPFQVHTAPEYSGIQKQLTDLLAQGLKNRGYRVLPVSEGQKLMAQAKIATLDDAQARKLAQNAKADFAVYGSLNQLGLSFSLDMRTVNAQGSARPYYTERPTMVELSAAVDEVLSLAFAGVADKNALADIQVRGLKVLDPDVVLVRIASQTGRPVNLDAINTDIQKVWDTGYFSNVSANVEKGPKGDVLVFSVEEKPRIDDVQVTGSDAVKIADITEAMSTRKGSVLNEKTLAQDIQKVTELYRKKGFYLAQVSYEVTPRPDRGTAVLNLTVNEGKKLYIREIKIEGLQNIKRGDLDDYLALKTRGMFSWLTGYGVLKEDMLERDTQAIQAYAVDQGYINAQVSAPEISYNDDGIHITYRVNEGERFALGDITFKGDLIDTPERLYQVIELDEYKKKNTYFSLRTLQGDVEKLTQFYNDYGYAFAAVDVESNMHENEPIVDIAYTLVPNEKVYIRNVELSGNYRTRDNVILRELRLADGQQFSGAALRRSTERLQKLGYFKDVNTELIPTGTPGEVDLKVAVEETNTGMLSAGVGYSTYDKFGVMAGVSESNLFGRGYNASLQAYLSGKTTSLDLNFVNPRIYNSNLGFGVNVYAREEEWDDFDRRTYGSTIRFSYPIGEYTAISFGYRLDFYRLYNIARYAAPSIKDYEGDNWASVLLAGIMRDSTNLPYNPTRGSRASINVDYGGGGIGGSDNFVKVVAEYGIYYGLNDSNVLHARATVGSVFRNSKKLVPAFERFYLGGMNSIRGFSREDLSPRDRRTGESIGADRMGYANLEYIWTFQKELGLALVPFFDIGVSLDSKYTNNYFKKPYYSTGLELRWRSPMGDLRFAYGIPLTRNVDNESRRSGRFEFTMGQAF